MDDMDKQVEVENPNPNGLSGKSGLIISIALLALGLVGSAIYAYAEHQNGVCLVAQLKALQKAQQAEPAHKPRPFLTPEMRADLDRAIAAAQHPDASAPVVPQAVQTADAGTADATPVPPKTEAVETREGCKLPVKKPALAAGIKAVLIHTLFSNTAVTEVEETKRALKKCGDAGTDLILVVKKVDGREKWPVLVAADPPMDEKTVSKYAICLQNQLPVYAGKKNQVEIVAFSDFDAGYAEIIQVRQPVPRH